MEPKSNEQFMRELDKADGMGEYSLPAEHVLNMAFVMEDLPHSENGQGYAWAESPKPEDYKVCKVPEYDPSVRIAALIKEAEDKVEAAEQALFAYSRQIVEKTCHKHKDVQRQKLELLQDRLNEANEALRYLRDGF